MSTIIDQTRELELSDDSSQDESASTSESEDGKIILIKVQEVNVFIFRICYD